ncbi:MAG: TRAP transporter small permease, partial [Planctomycetota bacterium]
MHSLRRFIDLIDWIARAAAVVFVLTILGVMSAQVYFRYVLNSSLQWSEEFSIWAMIWTVFIGSVIVIRHWEHIYIPTAIRILPLGLRPYFIIFSKI